MILKNIKRHFINGMLAILPILLSVFLLIWGFNFISERIEPLKLLLKTTLGIDNKIALRLLAFTTFISLVIFLGWLTRSRFKSWFHVFEENILDKFPPYKFFNKLTLPFEEEEKASIQSSFKQVCAFKPFGPQCVKMGFIVDQDENYYTVYMLSAMSLGSGGRIFTIKHKNVLPINNIDVDEMLRINLRGGAGIHKVYQEIADKGFLGKPFFCT